MSDTQQVAEGITLGGQTSLGPDEIERRFGFHKATIEGENATLPKHQDLRLAWREFAEYLDSMLPEGRAKSTMFTNLETASMWSHKAVADLAPLESDEPDDEEDDPDEDIETFTRGDN